MQLAEFCGEGRIDSDGQHAEGAVGFVECAHQIDAGVVFG